MRKKAPKCTKNWKGIDEKILMSDFATMCHFGSYEVIRYHNYHLSLKGTVEQQMIPNSSGHKIPVSR